MKPHRVALCWGVACLFAAVATSDAQTLDYRSSAGAVGNYVQPGHWSEVIATVRNPSDESQEVLVTFAAPGGEGGAAYFSSGMLVPPWTARKCRLMVLMPPRPGEQGPTRRRTGRLLPESELPLTVFSPGAGQLKRSYLAQTFSENSMPILIARGDDVAHDTDGYIAAGGKVLECQVRFLDASGEPMDSDGDAFGLAEDSEWMQRTGERRVPTGAAQIVLRPRLFGRGTGDMDDIIVTPIGVPAAEADAAEPAAFAGPGEFDPLPTLDFEGDVEGWRIENATTETEGGNAFLRLAPRKQDGEEADAAPPIELAAPLPPGTTSVRVSIRMRGEGLKGNRGLFGDTPAAFGPTRGLPTRWAGLDMIRLLLFKASAHKELRPSQMRAILDWTRRGGTLMLAADETMPTLLAGPFGRAAGVRAVGVHRVGALDVRSHLPEGEEHPGRFTLEWPFPMAELFAVEADVLYSANGLPLLTHRPLGQGRVFTLAVPLGALDRVREDAQPLHEVLLTADPQEAGGGSAIEPDRLTEPLPDGPSPAMSALQSIAGRRGPSAVVPVSVIGAFVALVVVAGVVLRRRRRGEWVWVGLVPLAVIVSIGLYAWGRAQVTPEQLSYIGLITPLGDGRVRVQESFAYYSGKETRTLDMTSGSERATIRPWPLISPTERPEVRTGPRLHLPEREVRTGAGATFQVDAVHEMPGLDGHWSFDADGLTGRVENRFPTDLTHCVVLSGGRTYRLRTEGRDDGVLPAGESLRPAVGPEQFLRYVEFESPQADTGGAQFGPVIGAPREPSRASGEFTGSAVLTRTDNIRNDLVGRIVRPTPGSAAPPVLIGYTDSCPLDPIPGREMHRQGWNIVAWPLAYAPPPADAREGRFRIPAGFAHMELHGPNLWNPLTTQFVGSRFAGELTVRAAPPEGFGRLRDATVTLIVSLRAPGWKLTVRGLEGGDPDGRRIEPTGPERTEFIDPRLRDTELRITNADEFRNAAGEYVFVLRTELTNTNLSTEDRPELKYERIDVALEGQYEEEQDRGDE